MKHIPLTKGAYALVDDADFETLSQHKWFTVTPGGANTGRRYAAQYVGDNLVYMHRVIIADQLSADRPFADHINGNGLDNRRANLRACTRSENGRNRKQLVRVGRTSKYKGVSFRKGRWVARIVTSPGHQIHLGTFNTEEAAALAYNLAATIFHSEFAKLNSVVIATASESVAA